MPDRDRHPDRTAVVVAAVLGVVLTLGTLWLGGRVFVTQAVANGAGVTIGLVIVWRGRDEAARRIGWLLTVAMLAIEVGSLGVLSDWLLARGHVEAARWNAFLFGSTSAEVGLGVLSTFAIMPVMFLAVAYPTGRIAPGWRWYPWGLAAMFGIMGVATLFSPIWVDDVRLPHPVLEGIASPGWAELSQLALLVASLLFLASLWSLRQRHRSPTTSVVERQQIKWFAFGLGTYVVTVLLLLVGEQVGVVSGELFAVVDGIAFTGISLSLGVAILRYRLYDIDRIVGRTLGYALTFAVLTGVFVLLVTTPVLLLGADARGVPPLLVSLATLVVAALFNPVRRRLLDALGRRFDRAHYDAAEVVAVFTATVPEMADHVRIEEGLADVLDRTVAPTSTAIWLARPDA